MTYERNALGQITSVSTTLGGVTTPLASDLQYLPFGPLTGLTLGNGVVVGRLHDAQYRLDALSDSAGSGLRDLDYRYDPAGNIDQAVDHLAPANSHSYAQDALNRLTAESGPYGALTYTYDANGNRTQRRRDGVIEQTPTYAATSNQVATLNGTAFTHDAVGNTLADGPGGRTFTVDDTNRPVQVRVGGVLVQTSTYNAEEQRVQKIEATGAQRTFYYHYGPDGQLLGETVFNSADQQLSERDYLWLERLPLAFAERRFDPASGALSTSALAYLHPDHLGTPRLATDAMQRVVWRWDSDAFGVGAAATDPDADGVHTEIGLRLPGQYFDAETGLHYNYFRDYDPQLGRYLQSDPIGLRGGVNTYAYVAGTPITFADPFGLCRCRAKGDAGQKFHQARDIWGGWLGSRHIVTCTYECETSDGTRADVVGTHHEWYFLSMNYDDGREGQCLGAHFLGPEYNYNLMRAMYSRDRFDWFDPKGSGSEQLERWAENACDCEK